MTPSSQAILTPTRTPVQHSASEVRLSFDRGTLLLSGMDQDALETHFDPGSWTWDPRVSAWRTHAIGYPAARMALRRLPAIPRSDDPLPHPQTRAA